MTEPSFTHVSPSGQPGMVDVGGKAATRREALARAVVRVPPVVMEGLRDGELHMPKGPVFHTAIVAGTLAVKRTAELIPFCHPLPIEGCDISITVEDGERIVVECRVRVVHKTGVEMEALTGASVAALTLYDMCKSVSHDIRIEDTRLIRKTGGKSDVGSS